MLASRLFADSSSTNAVNNSSARTTKRFPSSRCASATQIVRPRESIADTQPQLHPALLRLSATFSITHQAVAEAQDTLQVNSDSVRLKLENSSVRVLDGRLQPGGREKMHSHPPGTSSNFFENSRRVIP